MQVLPSTEESRDANSSRDPSLRNALTMRPYAQDDGSIILAFRF